MENIKTRVADIKRFGQNMCDRFLQRLEDLWKHNPEMGVLLKTPVTSERYFKGKIDEIYSNIVYLKNEKGERVHFFVHEVDYLSMWDWDGDIILNVMRIHR